jgi:hypothetical protein
MKSLMSLNIFKTFNISKYFFNNISDQTIYQTSRNDHPQEFYVNKSTEDIFNNDIYDVLPGRNQNEYSNDGIYSNVQKR